MSDEPITIVGDWWWVAAIFAHIHQTEPLYKQLVKGVGVTDRSRDGLTEIHRDVNGATLIPSILL